MTILVAQALHIGDRELEVGLALELILFEGEGEVDAAAVFVEKGRAFGRAPGDGSKAPAVLAEGHLQVLVLQGTGAVHNLDGRRVEDRAWIGQAEWGERVETADQILRDV